MSRRALALCVALAAALLGACTHERPGLPPRHIVVVTFDGLRADHLSCYAHARPTSALPSDEQERLEGRAFALDDLAASGVTFANAYAPSPRMLPSLATLFTGLSPFATGVLDEHCSLPPDVPTLAELARTAGFHTAAFVSRPEIDLVSAVGRGFEVSHWCRTDREALAFAREWLERDFGDAEQGLLWIHLSGLEPPWQPIPEAEIVRPEMAPLRFLDPQYHGPADGSQACFARVASGTPPLDPADRAALAELYDGRIAAVTGRLTAFLQDAFDANRRGAGAAEFWARTLLVVTATHGFDLGLRGGRVGAELHDDLLRVPLILRHPGSLQGERVLSPVVELADVLPTLVELFGLPRPGELPGRSLLGWTDAEPARAFEPRPAITYSAEGLFSVRDARWRMLWNPDRSQLPVALFDDQAGASLSENSAAAHPNVVARLQRLVSDWIAFQRPRPSVPLVSERKPESHGN